MQSEVTKKAAITRGVMQGDYLSPLLFSIVMDKIVSYVKHTISNINIKGKPGKVE